jgi:hypothetical protein
MKRLFATMLVLGMTVIGVLLKPKHKAPPLLAQGSKTLRFYIVTAHI